MKVIATKCTGNTNQQSYVFSLTQSWTTREARRNLKLKDLMSALATDLTCHAVNAEMELLKKKLCMTISEFTPEFIASWKIN
jgi:hypothetical protein